MSVSWDDLPEASKRVVIDQLDALRARSKPSLGDTEHARTYSANVRAIIDAALEKLARPA